MLRNGGELLARGATVQYNMYACTPKQRGGEHIMEYYLSFIIAVAANVVSHFICRWFDSEDIGRK